MDKITSIKVDDIKTKIDKQDIYIYNGFMAISKYIKSIDEEKKYSLKILMLMLMDIKHRKILRSLLENALYTKIYILIY